MNNVSASVEYSENSTPSNPAMADPHQSVEPERRKDHQMISIATYYQADRREFGYGSEEAQDWETDGETG